MGQVNNNHHQTNESKLLLEIHITYDTKLSFQAQKKEKKKWATYSELFNTTNT